MMQKPKKWLKNKTHGYSSESTQLELPEMNTNMMGFKWFKQKSLRLVLWTKVALDLEGLMWFCSRTQHIQNPLFEDSQKHKYFP